MRERWFRFQSSASALAALSVCPVLVKQCARPCGRQGAAYMAEVIVQQERPAPHRTWAQCVECPVGMALGSRLQERVARGLARGLAFGGRQCIWSILSFRPGREDVRNFHHSRFEFS